MDHRVVTSIGIAAVVAVGVVMLFTDHPAPLVAWLQ